MTNTLVIPRRFLTRWLAAFVGQANASRVCRLGDAAVDDQRFLFARELELAPTVPAGELVARRHLQLLLSEHPPDGWPHRNWPPGIRSQLWLRTGAARGFVAAILRTDAGIEPLHSLCLPGAGMHHLSLFDPRLQTTPGNGERHSRTVGALGGHQIWHRLTGLHFTIVGCGRTGSFVAGDLARLGAQSLTLIDPDLLEEHNLGEMDLARDESLGLPKVDALARAACELNGYSNGGISPLPVVVSHRSALDACRESDVIFSCVDNDGARLTTAILATLNHKVLVDIGTGIRFTELRTSNPERRNRVMGADVRLILPGDGCLLCRGNLTQYARAVEDIITHRPPHKADVNWQPQRAGSLRSLNQVAAGIAVQMLQDLVAERIHASLWAHLECDNAGSFSVTYPASAPQATSCPLCAKAGEGEAGLKW